MAEFIYQMFEARKSVGDKVILDDVTLSFFPGAKIGVVGPNGMGKSTLLKVMAGKEEVTNGEARLTPGYTVGLLEQEPPLDDDKTVIENVRKAFGDVLAKVERFNQISAEMADPDADFDALMAEMGKLQDEIDAVEGWDLDSKLSQAMDALQCPDPDTPVKVLAVTHDRYFLDNVAEWICEVDRGHLYPYKGNYSTYLDTKAARLEAQGQKEARLAKRLRNELEWVRSSPKARQAKNKARLERYEQMEAEAQAGRGVDVTDIRIPVGPRLGSKVLVAEHLYKSFGDRVLIDNLSFELPRNGIVGVIGPNGVGKSTLFKMIVGAAQKAGNSPALADAITEEPTSGTIELGETVMLSYVDQMRAGLDANKNVWEVVSGVNDFIVVGKQEINSRAYVAAFGFKGSDQQKPAGVLSGGERNRLNLALTLKQGGNLLLLDEPTNDLDTETLESLEEALLAFPGCSVITSHDRWFLDRVATHILAWEGTDEDPGQWHWFEGNFDDYQKDRVARLGEEAAKPHRIHRKLTRD